VKGQTLQGPGIFLIEVSDEGAGGSPTDHDTR
jgi:hypothetical protein